MDIKKKKGDGLWNLNFNICETVKPLTKYVCEIHKTTSFFKLGFTSMCTPAYWQQTEHTFIDNHTCFGSALNEVIFFTI